MSLIPPPFFLKLKLILDVRNFISVLPQGIFTYKKTKQPPKFPNSLFSFMYERVAILKVFFSLSFLSLSNVSNYKCPDVPILDFLFGMLYINK